MTIQIFSSYSIFYMTVMIHTLTPFRLDVEFLDTLYICLYRFIYEKETGATTNLLLVKMIMLPSYNQLNNN